MKKSRIANYVFGNTWAIDHAWAQSVLPWVLSALEDNTIEKDDSIQREKAESQSVPEEIAYIFASGTIGKYLGMSEAGVDLADLQNQLREFAASECNTLILHLDSPGGTVNGVSQTANLIKRIRESGKKIIGYTDTMACSAAYWLMAACDFIFADEHAHVGSIGVYSGYLDASKYYEKEGLEYKLVTSGKYKGAGAFNLPLTDDQRKKMQSEVDAIADDFKQTMVEYRDIQAEYMEGQSLFGIPALHAGYIDFIAESFEDVVHFANHYTRLT